jgi:hypothetical protein
MSQCQWTYQQNNEHIAFKLQHFAQYHQCDQFCNLA